MTVTIDLPADAWARLEAEAKRRGITLDQLVAELAALLPAADKPVSTGRLNEFLGSGRSGDPTWATRDIHELRHELAQRSSEVV
jgi:chromosome segregation and condensation protein ScpB